MGSLLRDNKYLAKEVRVSPSKSGTHIYFRETLCKGWRRYNKFTVPKYNVDDDFYTINFNPNKKAYKSKNILYAI